MTRPPTLPPTLTSLGGMAARMGLKMVLALLLNTQTLIDHVAAVVYRDETGKEFDKLGISERTVWANRVRSVLRAVGETAGI